MKPSEGLQRPEVGRKLAVTDESGRPVYLQLADQLKYLIWSGEFEPGSRLPPTRQLALNLDINRNTVQKAYKLLRDEGYVISRRGGGTIVTTERPSGGDPAAALVSDRNLIESIDTLVRKAAELGLSAEDLAAVVAAHARFAERERLGVVFLECNAQSLAKYASALEKKFGVRVVPMLVRDLQGLDAGAQLPEADCVVTTFFHLAEVRRALNVLPAADNRELFAISVRPHLSVLRGLESLERGSLVGVVYTQNGSEQETRERLARMTEMLNHADLGLRFRPILVSGDAHVGMFEGLEALVVRSENIGHVKEITPEGLPVIEFINELDPGSSYFLGQVFADLEKARGAGSQERVDADDVDAGPLPSHQSDR